jgi:ATP-dependent Clp protease ATP-binding subunit ClpA
VDFKNTVDHHDEQHRLDLAHRGGRVRADAFEGAAERVRLQMREHFRPEFLNRVDEIIVFRPLDETQLREIVGLLVEQVQRRLVDSQLTLEVAEAALGLLAREGYDPVYGARPLRRAIQRELENPLAKRILAGEFVAGDTIAVDAGPNAELTFTKVLQAEPVESA